MNKNDISTTLHRDINLRNAVRRHEEKSSPLPEHLNHQTIRRLNQINGRRHGIKSQKQVLTAIISAIAASLLLLITLKRFSENPSTPSIAPSTIAKSPNSVEEANLAHSMEKEHTSNMYVELGMKKGEEFKTEKKHTQKAKEQTDKHYLMANQKMDEKIMRACPVLSDNKLTETHVERHPKSMQPQEHKEEWQLEENSYSTEEEVAEVFADTLGCDILKSPENRLIALQMLNDCEATIERETQEVRNYLIEATFNVVPPSRNAILVIDENGDYNVVETVNKKIIEL